MNYFQPSFLKFFKELSRNNTTEWFNENRKTYEKEVKKPFSDFVEEMISRIGKYEPEVKIKPSEAIMRINKDIRFSKDKTPYNLHVGANISVYGKKDKSYPGFYFQFSHESIAIYGGAYMPDTATLQRLRNYILKNHKEFKEAYTDKDFSDSFLSVQGEKSKRIPKEFQSFITKEPLIANKQFYFSSRLKPEILLHDNLPETLMKYYKAGVKFNNYLRKGIS